MKLKILNNEKINKFASIFKNLKNIIKECCIEFKKDCIYIQGMDVTHALLFELKIDEDWFDEYINDKYNTFGIHCETLFKIINCLNSMQKIEFKRDEDSEILEINFIGDNNDITKQFELTEIQVEVNNMNIPEVEYQVDIIINTNIFLEIIKELTIFNENINIFFNEENIELQTNGTLGKAKIIIDNNNIDLYAIEEDTEFDLIFSGDYLNNISSFNKLNEKLTINSSKKYPLKLEYNLDLENNINNEDCEDELIIPNSYCRFYIASMDI